MLNRVTIMGRLVADPELRTTEGGVPMCSFRIACEEDYTSKDGQRETNFITVTAWRNCAEFISKHFTKGRMIALDGRLHAFSYAAQDGSKRYGTEVVAESVYFADSKPKDDAQPKAPVGFSAAPAPQDDDKFPF